MSSLAPAGPGPVCPGRTLYAADLDGTLLAPGAVMTDRTRRGLAALTARGALFTAATARSPATAAALLAGTGANAPAALMNGVLLFDPVRERILRSEGFSRAETAAVLSLARGWPLPAMIYTRSDQTLTVFYRGADAGCLDGFIAARSGSRWKRWQPTEDYLSVPGEALYAAVLGPREILAALEADVKKATALHTVLYREVDRENVWVFEAFSARASKAEAIRASARAVGAERIVAFGDNLNDLPLFEAADVRVAVANAVPRLKAEADFVCGANTEDGVVRWIEAELSGGPAL